MLSNGPLRKDSERGAGPHGVKPLGTEREACGGNMEVVQEPLPKRPRINGVFQQSGEAAADQADARRINPEKSSEHPAGQGQEFAHLAKYLEKQPPKKSGKQEFLDSLRYCGGATGSQSARHTDDGHLTKFGAKQVCVVCLGDHKAWECPATRCFVCYETGHEVKNCPNLKLTCTRCHRTGHSAAGCIRDALMNASRLINWDDVRCMRCGRLGHPNCLENQYPPQPPAAEVPGPLTVRPRSVAPLPRPPPPPPPTRLKAEMATAPSKTGKPASDKSWSWLQLADEDSIEEEAPARKRLVIVDQRGAKRSGMAEGGGVPERSDATDKRRAKQSKSSKRALDKMPVLRSGGPSIAGSPSGVLEALHAKLAKQKGRSGVNGKNGRDSTNGRSAAVLAASFLVGNKSPLQQSLESLRVAY